MWRTTLSLQSPYWVVWFQRCHHRAKPEACARLPSGLFNTLTRYGVVSCLTRSFILLKMGKSDTTIYHPCQYVAAYLPICRRLSANMSPLTLQHDLCTVTVITACRSGHQINTTPDLSTGSVRTIHHSSNLREPLGFASRALCMQAGPSALHSERQRCNHHSCHQRLFGKQPAPRPWQLCFKFSVPQRINQSVVPRSQESSISRM